MEVAGYFTSKFSMLIMKNRSIEKWDFLVLYLISQAISKLMHHFLNSGVPWGGFLDLEFFKCIF